MPHANSTASLFNPYTDVRIFLSPFLSFLALPQFLLFYGATVRINTVQNMPSENKI